MESNARLSNPDPTATSFRLELTESLFAHICLTFALLATLDGLLAQVQMIATGGHIFLPTLVIKICLYAVLILATAWQSFRRLDALQAIWLLVLFYLAADAVFLLTSIRISFSDLLIAYNSYYGYFLLAPLALSLGKSLSERTCRYLILAAFVPCFLIGSAQYFTQLPLLYTESLDGSFMALSWTSVEGGLRAYSLFSSSLGYGSFCCVTGALAWAMLLRKQNFVAWLALLLCSAFGCYTTLTRNCYVQFVFSLFVVSCLSFRTPPKRWLLYIPFVFLLLSAAIAAAGLVGASSDSAITSNVSTLMRAVEWQYYLAVYQNAPLMQKLLGLGMVQNAKATNDALIPIDNQYLGILMNIGLLGFLLVFWLHWKMWLVLYRNALAERSPLLIATAGFWSTFLAVYFYNVAIATFSLVFICALLVLPSRSAFWQTQKA